MKIYWDNVDGKYYHNTDLDQTAADYIHQLDSVLVADKLDCVEIIKAGVNSHKFTIKAKCLDEVPDENTFALALTGELALTGDHAFDVTCTGKLVTTMGDRSTAKIVHTRPFILSGPKEIALYHHDGLWIREAFAVSVNTSIDRILGTQV